MAREPFPTPRSNYMPLISGESHGTVTLLVRSDHPIDRSQVLNYLNLARSRGDAMDCQQ